MFLVAASHPLVARSSSRFVLHRILEHGNTFPRPCYWRMGIGCFVTAKQCICAALVKGCQHIKRDSSNTYGDPGQSIYHRIKGTSRVETRGAAQTHCIFQHSMFCDLLIQYHVTMQSPSICAADERHVECIDRLLHLHLHL